MGVTGLGVAGGPTPARLKITVSTIPPQRRPYSFDYSREYSHDIVLGMATTKKNLFRAKREKLGLTQQTAATHLGVAIATWCRWEKATRHAPESLRLLDLLDYLVQPGAAPKACRDGAETPLGSDALEDHLRMCKPCQLRIEFLHHEMDWL